MADYLTTLKTTLSQLVDQRRHIDADIADLQRIIARHEDNPSGSAARDTGRAAPPGEARRETLELLAQGGVWSPGKIARARGVSPNAVRAMLRRLEDEDPSPIRRVANGYSIASPKGDDDAQGSLSDEAEREDRASDVGG